VPAEILYTVAFNPAPAGPGALRKRDKAGKCPNHISTAQFRDSMCGRGEGYILGFHVEIK
jgi:hypothetical protein